MSRCRDRRDELDDELGELIAGGALPLEDEGSRFDVKVRIGFQTVIERDYVQMFRCWLCIHGWRLTCTSKSESGSITTPVRAHANCARSHLGAPDLPPARAELSDLRERLDSGGVTNP